jgi:hypothetical protein
VSAELPLRFHSHYRHVAYVSGVELAWLPADTTAAAAAAAAVAEVSVSASAGGQPVGGTHASGSMSSSSSSNGSSSSSGSGSSSSSNSGSSSVQGGRAAQPTVLFSYGAGDWQSRLLALSVTEVESLFAAATAAAAGVPKSDTGRAA